MDKVCSTKHKQAKHEWQELRHVSSIEFALAKQEPLSYGPLTKVEFFLLENILVYCGEQDIDVTPDNISKIYKRLSTSVLQTDPMVELQSMTEEKIKHFLTLKDIHNI